MTPDEFFQCVDREFNVHRDNGIRDLNEGNANPGDYYTAALTLTEHMVHHVFGNTDHFDLWCREHGLRMIAREGYGHYRIQRHYRAQRVATPIALDPVLNWNPEVDEQSPAFTIAETVEWTLADVFYRPNQDTVYIGLGNGDHGAQGGYVVPDDIAQHILNSQEDNRPESIEIVNGFDDVHSFLNFSDFKSVT